MYCGVHHQWQEMYGFDVHVAAWPMPPLMWPYAVHPVGAVLKWGPWGALTGCSASSVLVDGGAEVIQRTSDIGPGIPHLFIPHALLPGYWVFSGSKCEFAANTVHVVDKRLAVACFSLVGMNLNCGGFMCPPLPSGAVVAQTTVQAWMTLADFIAGVIMTILDSAIQHALNRLFNRDAVNQIRNAVGGQGIRGGLGIIFGQNQSFKAILGQEVKGLFTEENALSLLLGSPLGMSSTNIVNLITPANMVRVLLGPAGDLLADTALPASAENPIIPPISLGAWTPMGKIGDGLNALQDSIVDYFNSSSVNDE